MIKVRATKDGQKLYIKEISGEHNHELSEVMRYFSEGIEVLQSVASLWDGGKKVFVREATGITTVQ